MLDAETAAADAGIGTYDETRTALIARRNDALDKTDFESAVLLSHAIWWMAELRERCDS